MKTEREMAASFHRRGIRTGLEDREKRKEGIRRRSQSRRNELLDSKRGIPLNEIGSNDGTVSAGEL